MTFLHIQLYYSKTHVINIQCMYKCTSNKLKKYFKFNTTNVYMYMYIVYKSCSRIKVLFNYNIMINYESLVGN